LHPLIYCELILFLVDVRLPTIAISNQTIIYVKKKCIKSLFGDNVNIISYFEDKEKLNHHSNMKFNFYV